MQRENFGVIYFEKFAIFTKNTDNTDLLKKIFGVIYSTPQITLAHWVS